MYLYISVVYVRGRSEILFRVIERMRYEIPYVYLQRSGSMGEAGMK